MIFTREQKVGFFVLSAISLLIFAIIMLGDISFQKKRHFFVLFNNIEGLPDQAAVKVAGVEVGRVSEITLTNSRAKVKVSIKSDILLHEDSQASIVSTGIIGSKFLQLTLGSPESLPLKPGSTIMGQDVFSYEKIFDKLMAGIDEFRATLSDVSAEGSFGRNLNDAVSNIKRITQRLDQITLDHQQDIKSTLANFKEITEKLKKTIDSINNIAGKIENGDGVVSKLINDDEMGEELKSAVKEAKRVLDRINLFRTYWDYKLRYDFENEQYRSDLALKIYPRDDKFYYLGVNNIGDTEDNPEDPEEKNTFTAEIGKSFGPLTIHAGAIRSKGGLGIMYKPVERLEFNAEAYDFSRSTPKNSPVYTSGAKFKVSDWAYVGGQVEDMAGEKNFNTYFNVVFEDRDIAYLLGLVGLAQ